MMKKILLHVCCLLSFSTAICQSSVIVSEQSVHGKSEKTLIKEYRYPSTISCVMSDNQNATFIYSDQTLQTKEITVDNLIVNDMIVTVRGADGRTDTVYFCGIDLNTGLATFGYFNVSDAFNGAGSVYLHNPFLCDLNSLHISNLTRMVFFNDGINNHFACVGTTQSNEPCVLDLTSHSFPTFWDYMVGYLDNTSETMYDIKFIHTLQRDYLLTAGMDYQFGRYLNLRIYDANDVFSSSGIQNVRHIFCIDTSFGVPWFNDQVLVRALEDNFFVTVSYLEPELYYSVVGTRPVFSPNSVHIGVFDFNSLLSGSLSSMVTSAVFEPFNIMSSSLERFVNGPYRTLAFLERITNATGHLSSLFCEVDFNSALNVSSIRKYNTSGMQFFGMDSYDLYNRYVMNGIGEDDRTMLYYDMETFMSNQTCNDSKKTNYILYNPYRSVNRTYPFTTHYGRSVFQEVEVEKYRVPMTIECEKGSYNE